jgi:hypothetical protein
MFQEFVDVTEMAVTRDTKRVHARGWKSFIAEVLVDERIDGWTSYIPIYAASYLPDCQRARLLGAS